MSFQYCSFPLSVSNGRKLFCIVEDSRSKATNPERSDGFSFSVSLSTEKDNLKGRSFDLPWYFSHNYSQNMIPCKTLIAGKRSCLLHLKEGFASIRSREVTGKVMMEG